MEELLSIEIWGNTVQKWLIASGIVLGTYAALYVVVRLISRRLRKAAKGSQAEVVDLLADLTRQTTGIFLLVIAVYVGSLSLSLSSQVQL